MPGIAMAQPAEREGATHMYTPYTAVDLVRVLEAEYKDKAGREHSREAQEARRQSKSRFEFLNAPVRAVKWFVLPPPLEPLTASDPDCSPSLT